jgi:bifunctional non-homologous end joining protein LigD
MAKQKVKPSEQKSLRVGKRVIELSNQDKQLFPEGFTKGDVIDYYQAVAPYMVRLIKNRPLMMQRFPSGIEHEGFYQKNVGDYFPAWIKTVSVAKEGGSVDHVICNDAATLVYLANQACITLHAWLSRYDKLNYPDRMIFDLDPSKHDFKMIRSIALEFKVVLEELGCTPFVMTTGSRGMHVVVPLTRSATFEESRACAKDIARLMVQRNPKKLTIEIRKQARDGRVLVDYFRNAYAQTGVAPYAIRALPGAPIATPLWWDEVTSNTLASSQKYTLKNIYARLKKDDPWHDINDHAVSVKKLQKAVDALLI